MIGAAATGDWADVAVVGAGPAGSAAAARLAAAGMRVVLLEKERLPRYKTCGGGVVLRAAHLAGLAAHIRSELSACALHAAEMHLLDADLHFTVRRPQPFLFTTMRADLDAWLCEAARRAGATVRAPWPVRGLTVLPDGVELRGDAPVRARFVIAADGAGSRIARWAGWTEARCGPAIEWEVRAEAATLSHYAQAARFDFGLVPWGYAWVFPKPARLSVGMLSLQPGPRRLRARLERYLRDLGITTTLGVERHGALVPVAPRSGAFARGRVLLCGDAAGLVDPVTGEGISYALHSGQLAAAALLAAALRPENVRAHYEAALRAEILPELRLARLLVTILHRSPRLRSWLFRGIGQPLCEMMADVISGQRTYRELLGAPGSSRALLARLARARLALAHR